MSDIKRLYPIGYNTGKKTVIGHEPRGIHILQCNECKSISKHSTSGLKNGCGFCYVHGVNPKRTKSHIIAEILELYVGHGLQIIEISKKVNKSQSTIGGIITKYFFGLKDGKVITLKSKL